MKKTKRPYTRPSIKSEKIIETAALACGKCLSGGPVYSNACKGSKSSTS